MTAMIIGNGLIGSAVAQHLPSPCILSGINWADHRQAANDIHDAARMFLSQDADFDTIIWAAGAGVVASDFVSMRYETALVAAMLQGAVESRRRCTLGFVSSGGAVHGGNTDGCIKDSSEPAPISAYGEAKLEQELLVRDWVRRTGNKAVIFRPSNVYGPRQNLTKPQGFISQALWRLINHEPFTLTVPATTARDFIYADDVGRAIAWLTLHAVEGVTVRTVASGESVQLGELIDMINRITGRTLNVTVAETAAAGQPTALRFCTDRSFTSLSIGVEMTWVQMLSDNWSITTEGL